MLSDLHLPLFKGLNVLNPQMLIQSVTIERTLLQEIEQSKRRLEYSIKFVLMKNKRLLGSTMFLYTEID
jgi:hypothetical protein